MSTKKTTKAAKKDPAPKVEEPKTAPIVPIDKLSEEQYMKMLADLDTFQESFCAHLAGTAQYEILARVDEKGRLVSEDSYSLIKRECLKQGLKILYHFHNGKNDILFNPDTKKLAYLTDGEIH